MVVGHPHREGRTRYNAASVLRGGRIEAIYFKQRLPNYKVFDEKRYFATGDRPASSRSAGAGSRSRSARTCGSRSPRPRPRRRAPSSSCPINASPYHRNKLAERYQVMGARVKETGLPLLYVHWVGGQDELVFDGASFAFDADGTLGYQGETFRESVDIVEFEGDASRAAPSRRPSPRRRRSTARSSPACATTSDKNRFPGVLVGLSGGIDSALVAAVCADALGPERVHAVMMPSDYTASMSIEDAREMARLMGLQYTRDRDPARVRRVPRAARAGVRRAGRRTRPRRTCRRAPAARCSWRCRTSSAGSW